MPGIAGIISARAPHECDARVATMLDAMAHDPGWVRATIASPELGVYAGGLDRPVSESMLRERAASGLVVCGQWDAPRKPHDIERINGLFCALQIDQLAQRATLFNDRYALERLYVHEAAGEIHFASEAKALLAVLPSLRAFDERGVADYLTYGSVLEGRTLFRGVSLLPGGSQWTISARGRVHKTRYFEPAQWEALPVLDDKRFAAELDATFERVLPYYLRAPNEVGISLTGGLDTRMIMACLSGGAAPAIAYTYAEQGVDTLDVRIAEQVARECGVPHRTLRLDGDFLSKFATHADDTVYLSDGCASVLHTHEPDGLQTLAFTESGIVGAKLGFNSEGIGLAINGITTTDDDWTRFNKPAHVRFYEILRQRNFNDAVSVITGEPRACSTNFLIAQPPGFVLDIEAAPDTEGMLMPVDGVLTHANHFVNPEALGLTEPPNPRRIYSRRRESRLAELLLAAKPTTLEKIQTALRDTQDDPFGLCRHRNLEEPPEQHYVTVTSAVMDLEAKILHLTDGPPDQSDYQTFAL